MSRRLERQLFKINDEILAIREVIRQTEAELAVHQHLDDDARRDAAVGGPLERDDARETGKDVERFRRLVNDLHARIGTLQAKRAELLARLD